MSRSRVTNKRLPKRVYIRRGSYQFLSAVKIRDPKDGVFKFWISLASLDEGEAAMHLAYGKLLGVMEIDSRNMPYLCREFQFNKLSRYSEETQKTYTQYLSKISDVFEEFQVVQVTTKSCADFLRSEFKDKPNTADKYSALMRKLFKYAISELGLRQDNPIDQLDLSDYETKRRMVLPTHDQISAIRKAGFMGLDGRSTASGPMFSCLVDMSYLCWQRAIDVRLLKESQIANDRIRFTPSKTAKSSGKTVDIWITPAIQEVVDRARDIKKKYNVISPFLMPTQKGKPYTKSGLFSMWDRARSRAGIEDDVQYKDLRALGATDAARKGENIKSIQTRLAHTSSKTSEIYIKEAFPEASEIDMLLPWS